MIVIVSWLDTFNICPCGVPLPGIQLRLQRGMWLTVTAKMSLGDFSLTSHKGGSVWSHYNCPQIFSTEHSEVQPRKRQKDSKENMEVILSLNCSQTIYFLVFFVVVTAIFSLFSPNVESTIQIHCSPYHGLSCCLPKEGCRQTYATSVLHNAPSHFSSPSPAPHLQIRPIMFAETHNRTGGTAIGDSVKLKPLLNI